jgi:hypothetical protein
MTKANITAKACFMVFMLNYLKTKSKTKTKTKTKTKNNAKL